MKEQLMEDFDAVEDWQPDPEITVGWYVKIKDPQSGSEFWDTGWLYSSPEEAVAAGNRKHITLAVRKHYEIDFPAKEEWEETT